MLLRPNSTADLKLGGDFFELYPYQKNCDPVVPVCVHLEASVYYYSSIFSDLRLYTCEVEKRMVMRLDHHSFLLLGLGSGSC